MSTIDLPFETSSRGRWSMAFVLVLAIAVAIGAWLAWPSASTGTNVDADGPLALWQAQEIESYRYTLSLSCFCPFEMNRPVRVEIINGELASLTYVDDGTPANPMFFERHTTVEKLHGIIADAEAQNPARLDVTYDPATGVPLSVDIDISELMADEEIRFTVTDFERVS